MVLRRVRIRAGGSLGWWDGPSASAVALSTALSGSLAFPGQAEAVSTARVSDVTLKAGSPEFSDTLLRKCSTSSGISKGLSLNGGM